MNPGTHRQGVPLRTSSSMTHSALSTASIGSRWDRSSALTSSICFRSASPVGAFRSAVSSRPWILATSRTRGNGLADMLLGDPVSAMISTVTYSESPAFLRGLCRGHLQGPPNLTLDLGLRYDYATPFYEAHNRQSNFDYTTGKIIPAGTPGYPKHLANVDKADFAPRIGFSYSPFPLVRWLCAPDMGASSSLTRSALAIPCRPITTGRSSSSRASRGMALRPPSG